MPVMFRSSSRLLKEAAGLGTRAQGEHTHRPNMDVGALTFHPVLEMT